MANKFCPSRYELACFVLVCFVFFCFETPALVTFFNSSSPLFCTHIFLCFVQYKSTTADRGAISLTLVVYEKILQTLLQRSIHDHVYNGYSQYRYVKHLIDVITLFKESFVGLVEGVT